MTLTEFLLARIAEDEAAANYTRWAMQDRWFTTAVDKVDEFVRDNSPARALAECEAKRRIINEHQDVNDGDCSTCTTAEWGYPSHGGSLPQPYPCRTLRLMALPYSVHPDYDEEWGM